MSMLFNEVARITRVNTGEQNRNKNQGERALAAINPKTKGSAFYAEEVERIRQQTAKEGDKIANSTIKKLIPVFDKMRTAISIKSTKSDAPWAVLRLLLLSKLEYTNVPRIRAFAEELDGDPLSMQFLQEFAAKHHIQVSFLSEEDMHRAVDVLEGNVYNFVRGYRGDVDNIPASVKMMLPYFQDEADLLLTEGGNAEKTNALFWDKFVQIGTPDMFDGTGAKGTMKVQHYFKDLAGLKAYIAHETEGMDSAEKEKKVAEILHDCPDRYGAAYRNSISSNPSKDEIDINA